MEEAISDQRETRQQEEAANNVQERRRKGGLITMPFIIGKFIHLHIIISTINKSYISSGVCDFVCFSVHDLIFVNFL